MKKLTVTANNANDSIRVTIAKVQPNVNGCTGLAEITLTRDKAQALRDDLTRILEG